MKGFFITLEGGDGTGKTTQATLLQQRIQKETGRNCVKLREPGGTPICEDIRTILKSGRTARICELLLFNAARNQLVEEVIRPTVERGDIVVCDRFLDSTVAYQHYGNGIPFDVVSTIIDIAIADMAPNLTLLLQLSEDEANKRAQATTPGRDGLKKYDEAGEDFKRKVMRGYEEQALDNPMRIVPLDAYGNVEEVHERIWAVVKQRLAEAQLLSEP